MQLNNRMNHGKYHERERLCHINTQMINRLKQKHAFYIYGLLQVSYLTINTSLGILVDYTTKTFRMGFTESSRE